MWALVQVAGSDGLCWWLNELGPMMGKLRSRSQPFEGHHFDRAYNTTLIVQHLAYWPEQARHDHLSKANLAA
jgi:hypothetical protein